MFGMIEFGAGITRMIIFDNVMWATFGLEVSFAKIFADDTKKEKLDAANEHDDAGEAGPAGDGVAKSESFDDDNDNHDEGNETEKNTEEGSKGEGKSRESDNAFDSVFEEFPERPFGLAGGTLDVFVFDPFSLEADEAPEALRVAIIFGAVKDGIDHLTGHEAVITGAVDHFDFAHAIDEFIENAGEKAANRWLALAGDATGSDTIVAFIKVGKHVGEELGWVLTVGVHGGDEIACGVFETGEKGGFFAKVAREGDVADARVFAG